MLPEDRVVVSGDLAHGLEPLLFEAYPDEWPATLDRLAELEFDILVPGHGPVQRGRTMLTLFRNYLTELNQLVREGVSTGKSLATLQVELVVGHQNVPSTGKRSWAVKDTQISDMAFNLASEWSGVSPSQHAKS
jgi:glyoxylase-like metal-dependent hydrolase (beta-lactamase superfamily II)